MTRPDPPDWDMNDPDSEWVPTVDPTCVADPDILAGRTCRRQGCDTKPVAAMRRSHGSQGHRWWCYCGPHIAEYFRWVDSGQVWCWSRR